MARRRTSEQPPDTDFVENIVDIDVEDEMQTAFLEYAYSVIYSRALPDARDGLKPVQRRILFAMDELRLYPGRNHVKCSRVVGEVMGKYHPHGDQAIYDTLVRLAQPFTMRLPLVDGHGNFGSLDDGPAASRYTEARLAPAALLMTRSLDEDTVDFVPNYDESEQQPGVLPAAFPNLLVNGAAGIAVGMATNMPPHNLAEVVGGGPLLLVERRALEAHLGLALVGPERLHGPVAGDVALLVALAHLRVDRGALVAAAGQQDGGRRRDGEGYAVRPGHRITRPEVPVTSSAPASRWRAGSA